MGQNKQPTRTKNCPLKSNIYKKSLKNSKKFIKNAAKGLAKPIKLYIIANH